MPYDTRQEEDRILAYVKKEQARFKSGAREDSLYPIETVAKEILARRKREAGERA